MINRGSHLLKGWEMEQIGRTAWIEENPMHIKTVNTYSQYECVVVWCDDPCRVKRWKGYRVVQWQNRWDILSITYCFHSSSPRGYSKHSSSLFFGLIMVVSRPPQYEVDGRPRSWSVFNIYNCPAGCDSSCCPPGWLPQIPSEVTGSNKLFHQEFEALVVIGLVAMVPVVIAS